MRKQKDNYSKEETIELLKSQFAHAYSYKETYAQDYSDAWRYYRGMLPKDNMGSGIDPVCVVRQRVDEYFQIIKGEVTGNSTSPVRVNSRVMDSIKADKLSEAINAIVVDMNDFPRKLEAYIKETLLWGAGHCKVFIRDRLLDEKRISFEDWEQEQLDFTKKVLNANGFDDITFKITSERTKRPTKQERQEAAKLGRDIKNLKLFTGEIVALAHDIFPAIEFIPFQDIYVNPTTRYSLDESPYVCHKYTMSINDGLLNGWSKSVMEAGVDMDMSDPSFATTGLNVGKQFNPFDVTGSGITPASETNNFVVYEHYIRLAYRGKIPKLWKFTTTLNDFLEEPEELEEMPFVSARVIEIPNSFYGLGLYHTEKRSQDMLTLIDRMTAYTANQNALGRFTALKDSYDPESFTAARKGGVVEVYEHNAIEPLPVADISNAVQFLRESVQQGYQAESADIGKSEQAGNMGRTGLAAMSAIINKQEQAPRSMLATFCETGLIPIYRKVYKLARKMKHPITSLNAENFADFPKEISMTFDATTTGDKQTIAASVFEIMGNSLQLYNGGQLPPFMNAQTIYNLAAYGIKSVSGESDVSAILIDPSTVKPSPEQIILQKAQFEAQLAAIKAAGETPNIENYYKLSQMNKEYAAAALSEAQMLKVKADTTIEIEQAELDNHGKQITNLVNAQQLAEMPARLALEATEVQSGIIAEQANILNDNYAQGANVNVSA